MLCTRLPTFTGCPADRLSFLCGAMALTAIMGLIALAEGVTPMLIQLGIGIVANVLTSVGGRVEGTIAVRLTTR